MDPVRRLELQAKLEEILGSEYVYFQPPEDAVMVYPCIVFERDNVSADHANNAKYRWAQRYQVTLIDHDPDSVVLQKLHGLPYCEFNRHFATSGLNHDVFSIYH